jgi:molecular chaperone HscB
MKNLNSSDFDIFDLPPRFELDEAMLDAAYLRLQNMTHPDRFSNASAQEKRLAVQWSTRINEAYKRLKKPMERAIYWCELHGESPKTHQSNIPQALLIQQMEWRESLENAEEIERVEALIDEVIREKQQCLKRIAHDIDENNDVQAAKMTAQTLLFIDKFLIELNKKLEQLEDAS